MEEIIDILDIPVEELQTRDGKKVLAVYDDRNEGKSNYTRFVVIASPKGGLFSMSVQKNGKFHSLNNDRDFDIIRKKKKVLYVKTLEQLVKDGFTLRKSFDSTVDMVCVTNKDDHYAAFLSYEMFGKKLTSSLQWSEDFKNHICEEREE